MATKQKEVNYTPEMTAEMVKTYSEALAQGKDAAAAAVVALAEKFGKTTKSIVAKLSREKVYQAKEYVSKTGEKPVKKDEHADAIGTILGGSEFALTEAETESLTKANKTALAKIFRALANSKPIEPGDGNGE